MKLMSILGGLVLASSIHAQAPAGGWEATAEQVCIPDFRPAEDRIVLDGAAFDTVADGELILAIDGDGDGRGDRVLRLRPERQEDLARLREALSEATEFELFSWSAAPKTVRIDGPQLARPTWLVVRTPNCPLRDDWVAERDLLMLDALTWIDTPDGPELGLDEPPRPARMAEALARYVRNAPEQCRVGGPGALSCRLSFGPGSGACIAACAGTDQYACCAPMACGCKKQPAAGD